MSNYGRSSSSIELWFWLVTCVVCLGGSCAVGNYKCTSRAERMGMKHSWGPIQGCMVKAPRGWMPIEGVRDIE